MSQSMVLDIMKKSLLTIITTGGPILMISLLVGLLISIFQATTQIQEQTLSFVPKLVSVVLSLILFGNYIISKLINLTIDLYKLIPNIR